MNAFIGCFCRSLALFWVFNRLVRETVIMPQLVLNGTKNSMCKNIGCLNEKGCSLLLVLNTKNRKMRYAWPNPEEASDIGFWRATCSCTMICSFCVQGFLDRPFPYETTLLTYWLNRLTYRGAKIFAPILTASCGNRRLWPLTVNVPPVWPGGGASPDSTLRRVRISSSGARWWYELGARIG